MNNGKMESCVYRDGRFVIIDRSKIAKSTGPHPVTIATNPKNVVIYEDGNLVGKILKAGTKTTPTYHRQALIEGAVLDVEVIEINVIDGIGEVPIISTIRFAV